MIKGVAIGGILLLTAAVSFVGGVASLIKWQSDVLPGKILVRETEAFLEAVLEEPDL